MREAPLAARAGEPDCARAGAVNVLFVCIQNAGRSQIAEALFRPVAARALKLKVRKERDAGRTVILTSHNMAELESLADDVAFLLEGGVRYRGTLNDLKRETAETDLEGAIASMMTGAAQ